MGNGAPLDAAVIKFCSENNFGIEQEGPAIISKGGIAICTVDSNRQVAPLVVNQNAIKGYFALMKVLKENDYEILVGKD